MTVWNRKQHETNTPEALWPYFFATPGHTEATSSGRPIFERDDPRAPFMATLLYRNKCLTSSNKKLLVTRASLLVSKKPLVFPMGDITGPSGTLSRISSGLASDSKRVTSSVCCVGLCVYDIKRRKPTKAKRSSAVLVSSSFCSTAHGTTAPTLPAKSDQIKHRLDKHAITIDLSIYLSNQQYIYIYMR